jgi:FkbM family methyltransferase
MSAAIRRVGRHKISVCTIIDIGASDGSWSLGTMKHFPEANYLAIEPLKERECALKKLKIKYTNFDFELCVAGEKPRETASISVTPDLNGSTIGGKRGEPRKVDSRSIDSLVKEKNLRGPFLLKFDTHGSEIQILKGASNTLMATNIIIMEVYCFRHTEWTLLFYEMCAYLDKLGFRTYDLADPLYRPHDGAFWQLDLLFTRKDAHVFKNENYI